MNNKLPKVNIYSLKNNKRRVYVDGRLEAYIEKLKINYKLSVIDGSDYYCSNLREARDIIAIHTEVLNMLANAPIAPIRR